MKGTYAYWMNIISITICEWTTRNKDLKVGVMKSTWIFRKARRGDEWNNIIMKMYITKEATLWMGKHTTTNTNLFIFL